jgi:hydroxyacylglutathione hydrolase
VSITRFGPRVVMLGLFLLSANVAGVAQTSATSTAGAASGRPPADGMQRFLYLQGKVNAADGRALPERIAIERVCNGIAYREGFADSRGDFGVRIGIQNSSTFVDASVGFDKAPALGAQGAGSQTGLSERDLAGCEIRASVPGYLSDSITLGFRRALDNPYVGVIYLHPLARIEGYTSSATTANAPKSAANSYEKGLQSLKKQQWAEAEGHFSSAVREYPKFAIAWLELGRLLQQQNRVDDAVQAYQQALNADAKSSSPYKQLAAIAASRGAWEEADRYTLQVFKLDPDPGSEFYFYGAVANHYLGNPSLALEHAREAERLDPQHQNPKIVHLLGVLLAEKGASQEAAEWLRLYLRLMPSAGDASAVRKQLADLAKVEREKDLKVKWIHGSDPCSANRDAPFQVHAYDADTFILRQNKCIHYEAPFIYLLFGQDKVFMQDTGAAPPANSGIAFPVRETVLNVIEEWSKKNGKTGMQLIVTHSHAHGDHTGGDPQFDGQPNTTLVGKKVEDLQAFFKIKDWPNEQATLDLGGRILDIIPIPGHDAASIAVYDRTSRILLTGDTVYPGRLYIRDWPVFKSSIGRLAAFVKTHEVAHVLGTHIEMSRQPGVDYPIRTTYQPEERALAMTSANILELYDAISRMRDTPVRETHNDFIIYPR